MITLLYGHIVSTFFLPEGVFFSSLGLFREFSFQAYRLPLRFWTSGETTANSFHLANLRIFSHFHFFFGFFRWLPSAALTTVRARTAPTGGSTTQEGWLSGMFFANTSCGRIACLPETGSWDGLLLRTSFEERFSLFPPTLLEGVRARERRSVEKRDVKS